MTIKHTNQTSQRRLALIVALVFGFGLVIKEVQAGDCDPSQCNGWVYWATAFYGEPAMFCWASDDTKLYACENMTRAWLAYPAQVAPDVPCHGSFFFSIFDTSYYLNGTNFPNKNISLAWYLARLRNNEGNGWFFCSAVIESTGQPRVFYYNGSYFDVYTDQNGTILKVPQKQSQYELIQFKAVTNIAGCETGCCWLQDYYSDYTSTKLVVREFLYRQSLWYMWDETDGNNNQLYSGFGNKGIARCLKRFATNITWTYQSNAYWATNGTIFMLTGKVVTTLVNLGPFSTQSDYNAIAMTALSDKHAYGTIYFGIEGSVFSYGTDQELSMVVVSNGLLNQTDFPTSPTAVSDGHTLTCGFRKCSGLPFYSNTSTALLCLSNDIEFLTFCEPVEGMFFPMVSRPFPNDLCVGNFNFQILSTSYWLNWTRMMRMSSTDGGNWVLATNKSFDYSWYLSRLRPSEGEGELFCTQSGNTFQFDGTAYHSTATNLLGYLVAGTQSIAQYNIPYFFANVNEIGCQHPVCCWFNDWYISGKTKIFTEFFYNGVSWMVWFKSYWLPYSGDFNAGILRCAGNYFSDMMWSDSPTYEASVYQLINGSIFDLVDETTPVANFTASTFIVSDPLTMGGFYYSNGSNQTTFDGLYQNVSGMWGVYFVNGAFAYRLLPPNCADDEMENNEVATASCLATPDFIPVNYRTICNPRGPNTCGPNYRCEDYSEMGNICSMGVCVPNYQIFCPITTPAPQLATKAATGTTGSTTSSTSTTSTTTTVAPLAQPQVYGSICYYNSDCYCNSCIGGICSCPSCSKFLPYVDYSWRYGSFVYGERCIPSNSTIGGIGDACNMWAQVPSAYCAFGTHCSKCPELWNSNYANATCVAYNATISVDSCSASCGYLATCALLEDVEGNTLPVCTCPAGYHLESNMKDCYGWNVTSYGSCSATCSWGQRSITRYCDKASGSHAKCDGTATITVPCSAGFACPMDQTIQAYAVLVKLQSKVLTVDLFRQAIEPQLKVVLAKAITSDCINDKDTFEQQCCPGKKWPSDKFANRTQDRNCINSKTGISFYSEFTDGNTFSFFVTVSGDSSSSCCTKASSSKRKRRSTGGGQFDIYGLAAAMSQADVIASLTAFIQLYDPNVVAVIQTVPTTTTPAVTQRPYDAGAKASLAQGLPVMVIGIAGGIAALLVVVGVIAACIIVNKQKAAREAAAKAAGTKNNAVFPTAASMARPKQAPPPAKTQTATVLRPSAAPPMTGRNYRSAYPGAMAKETYNQPAPERQAYNNNAQPQFVQPMQVQVQPPQADYFGHQEPSLQALENPGAVPYMYQQPPPPGAFGYQGPPPPPPPPKQETEEEMHARAAVVLKAKEEARARAHAEERARAQAAALAEQQAQQARQAAPPPPPPLQAAPQPRQMTPKGKHQVMSIPRMQ